MVYASLESLSAILLIGFTIFADGTPVNTFSATSYTSDSKGSHSIIVAGDDSGTKVGVGSGPPASDSDSIMSRFASPANTPKQNQTVFFIPAGQDKTISTGNTVISTRSGSGTGTSQISQVSSTNGGSHSIAAGYASSKSSPSKNPNDDYVYNNDGYDD